MSKVVSKVVKKEQHLSEDVATATIEVMSVKSSVKQSNTDGTVATK
jgi:hypothetical protein